MTARSRTILTASICALLVVPRVVRLLHPQVWIEDESYLTGAQMLSHGLLPYRDFPLPHYPLLEALLAAVFRLTKASIRSAEVTTQMAALAGSLLVFALGRRLDGLLTGTIAAAIFATSGLLFRYHLFEREVFVVVPVIAAVLLACRTDEQLEAQVAGPAVRGARPSAKRPERHAKASAERSDRGATPLEKRPSDWSEAIAIGGLLFVALAIKLTAVAALAAVGVHLWMREGRLACARTVGVALGLLAALTIVLAAVFGTDFIVQVFVFRAIHAAFPSLAVKLTEMRLTMDVSLAAGAAGVALILWTDRRHAWMGPLLQMATGFVVLVLFNPTYWAHTGIELLPWLSLAGGFLVASLARAVWPRGSVSGLHAAPAKTYACAIGAVALLVFVAPLPNLNWEAGDGSVDGFGYRDRSEIEAVAAYVRTHTDANAPVATPPIIAFAADRRELVPYPEIAGTVDELTDAVRRRGYFAALGDADLRHDSFWESVEASRARIAPQILNAVIAHRVSAVVGDSPEDLMPVQFVNVPQAALEANGYQIASAFAHYDVWLRR